MQQADPTFRLSKKELASVGLTVNVLPFPPVPVRIAISTTDAFPAGQRKALNVATSQLVSESSGDAGFVSSHNAIAGLMLYHRWSGVGADQLAAQQHIDRRGKLVLGMMEQFCEEHSEHASDTPRTPFIERVFRDMNKRWIESFATVGLDIRVTFPGASDILAESPMHAAMAGYCYSQGFLYSQKNPVLRCSAHTDVQTEYQQMLDAERDGDAQALDDSECRGAEMEMTRIYGRSSYDALKVLCGVRIMKDTLYGFVRNKAHSGDAVHEQARKLLRTAGENCERMLARREQAAGAGTYIPPAAAHAPVQAPAQLEGPAVVQLEGPAVQLEGPAVVQLEGPAVVQLEDPAEVQLEDPAVVQLEDPAVVQLEDPAPVKTKGPAVVQLEGPAVVQTKDPAPVQLEGPAVVQTKDPAPVQLEDPAPDVGPAPDGGPVPEEDEQAADRSDSHVPAQRRRVIAPVVDAGGLVEIFYR